MGYLGLCMAEPTAPSKERSFGTVPLHLRLYTQHEWGGALRRLVFGGEGIVVFIIGSDFGSRAPAEFAASAAQSHRKPRCFPARWADRVSDQSISQILVNAR